ncbi:hypothetical protein B0F90DRAFT_1796475, partial [Multifurca ochricompacta]
MHIVFFHRPLSHSFTFYFIFFVHLAFFYFYFFAHPFFIPICLPIYIYILCLFWLIY